MGAVDSWTREEKSHMYEQPCKHFPKISEILQKLFESQTIVFELYPKIAEDFRGTEPVMFWS